MNICHLLPICLLPLSFMALGDATSAIQKATDSGASFVSKYSSPEAMQNLIVRPMISNGTLETTDGSRAFSGQIMCGSEVKFLEVLTGINASGEISIPNVSIDSNGDGVFDVTGSFSDYGGVCSNGVIKCDTGTWKNCGGFAWRYSSTSISLDPVPLTELADCRCINNECAPGYSSIHFNLLQDVIGASISQTLARHEASFAISRVQTSGPTITYFGQRISSCAESKGSLATSYFNDSKNLVADANKTIDVADTKEAKLFNSLVKSPAVTHAMAGLTVKSCEISRNLKLDEISLLDVIAVGTGTATTSIVNSTTVDITIGKIGNNYYDPPGNCGTYSEAATLAVLRPDRITSAALEHVIYDDHAQVLINDSVVWNGPYGNWTDPLSSVPPSGSCERETSHEIDDFYVNLLPFLPKTPGNLKTGIKVRVGGKGEGYARVRVEADTSCKEGVDEVIDTCGAIAATPSCTIKNEVIDGVPTILNGVRLGASLLMQNRIISSATCSLPFKREWLKIERTYECEASTKYEFESAARRAGKIESSTTATGYTDSVVSVGSTVPVESSHDLRLFTAVDVPRCTLQCKVRTEDSENDVLVDGTSRDQVSATVQTRVKYKECSKNICPLESGETMIQDCGCINGFSDAAIMMQLIRLAGSDLLCSSGSRQEP